MTEAVVVGVALGAIIVVAAFGWSLVRLGCDGGDRPGDATSRISADGRWLVVTNRASTPVVVGVRVRRPPHLAALTVRPALVVRPARRYERGPTWSAGTIGAVAPGRELRWPVPAPMTRYRLEVAIGQTGGRLRVHDHLVGAGARTSCGSVPPGSSRDTHGRHRTGLP